MQDRYVGDVGDFGKYGLLRALVKTEDPIRLGVLWYRFPDETHNNDGQAIRYLSPSPKNVKAFRACDPELWDELRKVITEPSQRNLEAVQRSTILPRNTLYHCDALSFDRSNGQAERSEIRSDWTCRGIELTEQADLVFFDPDNGLECGSVKRTYNKGPKYVFLDDLRPYVRRRQTLLIYHSPPREKGGVVGAVARRRDELRSALGVPVDAVLFRRKSVRSYFLVHGAVGAQLAASMAETVKGPWGAHFESVPD